MQIEDMKDSPQRRRVHREKIFFARRAEFILPNRLLPIGQNTNLLCGLCASVVNIF